MLAPEEVPIEAMLVKPDQELRDELPGMNYFRWHLICLDDQ